MRNLFFLLLIVLLAFLEATFVSLHLILLMVISLGVWLSGAEVFLLAIFAGLILDLIKGGVWGLSSLQFLTIVLLISLYKNRFQAKKLWFVLPLTLICVVVNDLLVGGVFSIVKITINTGLIIFFLPLVKLMIKKEDNKLKL